MLAAVSTLALVSLACDRPADEARPDGDRHVAQADEDYQFILMSGDDTVAVEAYTRTGDRLEGELRERRSGDRVTYRVTTGEESLITRLEISAYTRGGTAPEQQVELTVRGDSLIAGYTRDGSRQQEATLIPSGTLLYLNPSVALLEQMLRRARAVGGERVGLTVLSISADDAPELVRPTITWIGTDSVHIAVAGDNQVHGAVDGEGRILRAVNPMWGVRIERRR
jgi:hypothetical protein